jgi:hypothetical protein
MKAIKPLALAVSFVVLPFSATADTGISLTGGLQTVAGICKDTAHSSGGTICNGRSGFVAGTYKKAESATSAALALPAAKAGAKQVAKRVGVGAAAGAVAITAPAWAAFAAAAATIAGVGMLVYDGYHFVSD